MKSVLITGTLGLVGYEVAGVFLQNGWSVIGIDINQTRPLLSGISFVQGNVLDSSLLQNVIERFGISGIVHTAAMVREAPCLENPANAVRVNVEGTANVLEAARQNGISVTYLSTATLYGRDRALNPLLETAPPSPVGLYDTTKLMGEQLCSTYRDRFGVHVAAVRTGFVYGVGQTTAGYFVSQAARGIPVCEPDGADHPVDYTYVKDLARGVFLCHISHPCRYLVYNVTGGRLRRRREFADAVRAHLPNSRIELGEGVSERINLRGPCVLDRASSEFGYQPEFSIEEGVADWIRSLTEAS